MELIRQGAPHLIANDTQLAAYTEELFALTSIDKPNGDEAAAIGLLTLLIQTYEREAYDMPQASPVEVLQFLLDSNRLTQKHLQEIGTPSDISLILSGKRDLTAPQIDALARRFNVAPSVFFGTGSTDCEDRTVAKLS
ncbi:helix-turn-helix domain-containing protein [Terriglobus sp.]|uniref:helix-turn-helix domain-containing protein n=1 Tax=Terriglobus sp. TaxID=1889013 RepID=UPI003B00D2AD